MPKEKPFIPTSIPSLDKLLNIKDAAQRYVELRGTGSASDSHLESVASFNKHIADMDKAYFDLAKLVQNK